MNSWRYILPLVCLVIFMGLHPFLALSRPVETRTMILEGWIPEASIKFAAELFLNNNYELILTTGGDTPDKKKGASLIDDTYAESAKRTLIDLGIDQEKIVAVKTDVIGRSRTYSYAQSSIQWLMTNRAALNSINVISLDAHARKSYVLYKKAADKQIEIGVIACPPVEYGSRAWFFSVYGIGFVLKNFIGYLYALTI